MLTVVVPAIETYVDSINRFISCKETTLHLEHSLITLSKWESIHHKPFIGNDTLTDEEILDYIRCMTINPSVIDSNVYYLLTNKEVDQITRYLEDPMSAFTKPFAKDKGKKKLRSVISEDIYAKMIELNIPVEFQKWHLNRLFALINKIDERNQPEKKMTQQEIMDRNRQINEMNRKRFQSKG